MAAGDAFEKVESATACWINDQAGILAALTAARALQGTFDLLIFGNDLNRHDSTGESVRLILIMDTPLQKAPAIKLRREPVMRARPPIRAILGATQLPPRRIAVRSTIAAATADA